MTIPTATKNAWLNGQTITHASLHTAFPGSTGTSEVTGGAPAYAKQAVTMNAASGGSRLLNAGVTFDVPASTIAWVGFFNSGVFLFCAPNGGATPKNFVAIPSTDLIYCPGHGYPEDQKIVFYDGTAPTPLVEGTTYRAVSVTTDTFKVAATAGGTAIDLTVASSFGCVVCAITEQVYAIQSTHALTSATLTVPD